MHSSFVYFDGEDNDGDDNDDDGEDVHDVYDDNDDCNGNGNDKKKHRNTHAPLLRYLRQRTINYSALCQFCVSYLFSCISDFRSVSFVILSFFSIILFASHILTRFDSTEIAVVADTTLIKHA